MMIIPALLTATVSSMDAGAATLPSLDSFTADAETMILEGRELPRDYRAQLLRMSPADRLLAIIFLRRSGLLNGNAWELEDVLRPPEGQTTGETHK